MKTKLCLNDRPLTLMLVGALASTAVACVSGDIGLPDDDEDVTNSDSDEVIDTNLPVAAGLQLTTGINGSACAASPFNCKFRASGGNRVVTQAGDESWGIAPGASVRDGNGNALTTQNSSTMTFNYGQTRLLAGKAHALALSTSNGSAGWYPLDHIKGEASFRSQNGEVNGKDPGRAKMACYQIRNTHDASIELKKVVYDAQTAHERVGDYLPLLRNNGVRSTNLVFSVPGFALGGATTDHFQAGTKFQRVDVPTASGKPSITIPTWIADGQGAYKKRSGSLRFFYGYVIASDGVKRFGWMSEPALQTATNCL